MGQYSDLFEEGKPQAPNPGLAVQLTADAVPQQEVRYKDLASRYKVPVDVVRTFPKDYETKAKVDDIDTATAAAPHLRSWLADTRNTPLVDTKDVGILGMLEGALRYTVSAPGREGGLAGDVTTTLTKGAVAVPQAIVGLLDIPTFGYAGKGLEAIGVRFKDANTMLSGLQSPELQGANKAVQDAHGFFGTIGAALRNPAAIASTIGESLPLMGAGGVAGGGLRALAPNVAPWLAAAAGEGVVGAGSAAEGLREGNADGLLSVKQSFAAVMSGVGTAIFGAVGGKVSQKLGIADLDTMLVKGGMDAANAKAVKSSFLSSIAKAGLSEGVFEELPQSVQEQMWQNFATDKPIMEGALEAGALGMLAGAAGGVAAQVVEHHMTKAAGRINADQEAQRNATQSAQQLGQLMALAAQTQLREQSPGTFAELTQHLAEQTEGAPTEVRFDAQNLGEVLNQEEINLLPSIKAQLESGELLPGDEVSVPIGELMANVAGTPLEQKLMEHARVGDNELSAFEAKEAAAQAETYLQSEAKRVISEATDSTAHQASRDKVKQIMLDQFTALNRWTADVNEANSIVAADMFTALAGRLGMTPEQAYQAYPLKITGVNPATQGVFDQAAHHGSPHDFNRFSLDHIGTGEGAQAYGHGLYFAEDPGVAGGYHRALAEAPGMKSMQLGSMLLNERNGFDYSRKAGTSDLENIRASLAEDIMINENDLRGQDFREAVLKMLDEKIKDYEQEWPEAVRPAKDLRRMLEAPGALKIEYHPAQGGVYTVDIPDEHVANFLLWDKPLSEQPESVRDALYEASRRGDKHGDDVLAQLHEDEADPTHPNHGGETTGQHIYQILTDELGSQEKASKYLDTLGIKGIKYLDGNSRDGGDGTHNLVVFDDKIIKLTHKDGKPVTAAERGEFLQGVQTKDSSIIPEQSKAYSEAIAKGNRREALRVLHNALGIKDKDASIDRGGAHAPSGPEDGAPAYDVAKNGVYPEDVYSNNGLKYYSTGEDAMDADAYAIIKRLDGHPNATVTIYRAVEKDAPNKILPGDWVTTVRQYAKDHGEGNVPGGYKIVKQEVKARDIFTSGDSWLEWGYHPQDFKPEIPKGDAKNTSLEERAKAWAGRSALEQTASGTPLQPGTTHIEVDGVQRHALNSNALREARDVAASAAKAYDDFDAKVREDAKNGIEPNADDYLRISGAAAEAEDAFAAQLAKIPDEGFALQSMTRDGRMLMLNKSAQSEGKWQLTRFAKDGTPWGDTNYPTKAQAIKDFLNESDLSTVKDFYQNLEQTARGTFNPGTLTISLLEKADLSTFHHELAHFYLEVLADIASQPDAPESIKSDMDLFLNWAGVKDLAAWNALTLDEKRAGHEKFAEHYELYLFEGKAPSQELQPLFRRFASWMKNVYTSLKAFMLAHNSNLTPEVRGIYDRMLATEAQIEQAEAARKFQPLFASAEEAGMDPAAWAAYQLQAQEASESAIENLQARSLRDAKWMSNAHSRVIKAMQKAVKGKIKETTAEVTAEVEAMPVYAAKAALDEVKGTPTDADLQLTSERFGFSSPDEMLRAFAEAQPKAEVIEGMTDQRLLERYGDLTTEEGIKAAADEAIHNEARARFAATELRALSEGVRLKDTRRIKVLEQLKECIGS